MKALKYILFVLLIVIIGFCIYVAVQPNSFEVKRTRTIKAPATVLFTHVSDFKNWEAWSPWVEANPETVITLSDKTEGIGGSYSWKDDDGFGTMTTVSTASNKYIDQEMQFEDYSKSDVNWAFEPNKDGSTDVTWKISGKDLPFDFKFFTILMGGMEKQIGPYFERGLEKLDAVIQEEMKRYSITVDGVTQHSGGFYLYNTTSCKFSNFKEKMQEQFPKIGAYALTNNIIMAGKPFVIFHKWDEVNDAIIFSCAIPTNSRMTSTEPDILTGQLPSFKAVKTILRGDYENLKEAWEKTTAYIEKNNLSSIESGPKLEVYLTDPQEKPNPADWITEIFIAVE